MGRPPLSPTEGRELRQILGVLSSQARADPGSSEPAWVSPPWGLPSVRREAVYRVGLQQPPPGVTEGLPGLPAASRTAALLPAAVSALGGHRRP